MLFDISKANIEILQDDLFIQKQISLSVLRLDKIHPLLSGNKIFKLHYFLEQALQSAHKTILTFGGAYSNHLAATAFACKALQLKSIGIVRGERPAKLSATLLQCIQDGMLLEFISRTEYDKKENPLLIDHLKTSFGKCIIIPEGGYHPLGAQGASLIYNLFKDVDYTHICTASGTATTLAGLLMAGKPSQTIISVPVLKGTLDNIERITALTGRKDLINHLQVLENYHFGGYAKKTNDLIAFINQCWQKHSLPLDFVYTAKMFFAVIDAIQKDVFEKGSNIICLHTGGLQGNKSLPLNTLLF